MIILHPTCLSFFFFFNDTATTEIYTLSLHDALPISISGTNRAPRALANWYTGYAKRLRKAENSLWKGPLQPSKWRSEEHTSELQSQSNLVCRLLLEKKKKKKQKTDK